MSGRALPRAPRASSSAFVARAMWQRTWRSDNCWATRAAMKQATSPDRARMADGAKAVNQFRSQARRRLAAHECESIADELRSSSYASTRSRSRLGGSGDRSARPAPPDSADVVARRGAYRHLKRLTGGRVKRDPRAAPTRRRAAHDVAVLPLAAAVDPAQAAPSGGRTLEWRGSPAAATRQSLRDTIARSLQADRFEIQPAPSPDDYFETVDGARTRGSRAASRSRLSRAWTELRDPLYARLSDLGDDGTARDPVFPVGRHDLEAKDDRAFRSRMAACVARQIRPGSRGSAARYLQARLVEGLTMARPQERQTIEQVAKWLDQFSIARRSRRGLWADQTQCQADGPPRKGREIA